MEKRVAIFLILSLLIVLGWNYLAEKMGWIPKPPPPEEEQVVAEAEPEVEPAARTEPTPPKAREEGVRRAARAAPVAPVGEPIVVETDLYRAEFSSRGAVIAKWELSEYTEKGPNGSVPVQLVYQEGQFLGPLGLTLEDEAVTKRLREAPFRVSRDFDRVSDRTPVGRLVFEHVDPETGLKVEKELTFRHDSYVVKVQVRTTGITGTWGVNLGTNFGIVEWGEGFIGIVGPAFLIGEEVEKEMPEDRVVRLGPVKWLALQDKYFISALMPEDAKAVRFTKEAEKVVSARAEFPALNEATMRLYAGPKQYDRLKAVGVNLEDTIDFGWFIYGSWDIVRWIAKPLFKVLRFFYEYTHNYGWSIILLTVCIKLLFVPLQYKSYKSMKDMQVIQPKMQELQKKYKDDRDRLNKELIKLYRDHKVNPVGGCLPLFLQMPVFIALFNILYMTIDLRQAPFILWITDLSVPDPYYVLPILMGVSMVVQQKIMPTTMDPTQARMMLLLPVFLTFIFLNFAAGLVLYWFTNNVLTIAQQFITDRYIFKRPTFTALTGASAEEGPEKPAEGDGQKGGGKGKKDKAARKAEADTPVES